MVLCYDWASAVKPYIPLKLDLNTIFAGYGGNGGMSMGNPHENVVEVIIVPDNSVGLGNYRFALAQSEAKIGLFDTQSPFHSYMKILSA